MTSPTKKPPKRPHTPSAKAKDLPDTMEIFADITAAAQNEGSTPKRAKKRPLTLETVMKQVQEGMANIAAEITSLKEEVHHLRTQLQEKESENRSESTESSRVTTTPTSYASAVGKSQSTLVTTPLPTSSAPQANENGALYSVQINMVRVGVETYDLPTIKKELESVWEECIETAGIKCRVVKSTKEHTLRLLFKANEDAMAVRKYTSWLKGSFRQARIEGEQWYPIKVDRVNKLSLKNLHDETVHGEICRMYGEENDVEIKKMRWLGGKEHLLYGSLVVYLSEKKYADRLLQNQTMEFKGESGFTKFFIQRIIPQRCFHCHEYRHHQLRCKNEQVCGHCAEKGHDRVDCMSPSPKCVSCQGPHQANDSGCPIYKEMLAKILPNNTHA